MSAEISPTPVPSPLRGWQLHVRTSENLLIVLALALMMVVPLAEILLRKFFHTGIVGSSTIVQHLTLIVGMLGGALAAREGRLLALSTATNYFKGGWKIFAAIFGNGFAAAVSLFLCVASARFIAGTMGLNKILAYGIPVWVVQLFLPLGFGLVALRLIWNASTLWKWRLLALALCVGVAVMGYWSPFEPEKLRIPALAVLLIATLLGAPVFATLGGAALILFWSGGDTVAGIPSKHYQLVTNPTLPSIPLFTLAGYFLAEGGASKRLVRVFLSLFGNLARRPRHRHCADLCFFHFVYGASGVTILALGGLLMPVLVAAKYSERSSLGLLTGAGSLGLLFPPCLPPILYAIVASTSGSSITMQQMYQGGLLPGILLMTMAAGWGIWCSPKIASTAKRFNQREARQAIWTAKWELLIPVVALATLFGGFATPVEAAAVTAGYALFCELIIYRDLKLFKDVPRVMTECGLLIGGVLLILGVALGFTYYLIDAQIPDKGVEWVTAAIKSKLVFLLVLNLFLLIVGCLMDIYSAIVVVVPLIVPLGVAFGIDPVHLGIIFLANLELGYLTPPVGMNLFLASYRFGKPMVEVIRATMPMLIVMLIGVLLITYLPWLTTFLPGLFQR